MKTADVLAQRLSLAGCRHAFGIPGGEVLTLLDGLRAADIRFVLAKHENAAGFMAEGTYHRTRAPGILLATIGPGAANCVNVAANALQDRVPLIILTGCVDAHEELTYTHQIMDHQALFRPVVKATFRMTAANVNVLADKAVAIALEGRPGPVHIDVPMGVADAACDEAAAVLQRPAAAVAPADGADLATARQWLAEAERPLMVAGLDILTDQAEATVRAFVERFSIPLITTYKGKGILPEDHALAMGGAGLSPLADGHLKALVEAADLVLLAGYDPIEMRSGWRDLWQPDTQRVVEFAAEANRHYMHQAGLSFVCPPGAALDRLADGVAPAETWPCGRPAEVKAALAASFGQGEDWGPTAVVEEVRAALPRDGLATVDSGAHRILLSQVYPCFEPAALTQSTGLCTMGCALPLAIGAKLASPERAVVAFTGDAGLLMVMGELATAAELGQAVVVVVFVDANLALIDLKQERMQLANVGVHMDAFDYAAVAEAMGGRGFTVTSRADLRVAMAEALAADRFSVIGCVIERQTYRNRL